MRNFGLIGKTLTHSFSQKYFEQKFKIEGIKATYTNYELASIQEFPKLLDGNINGLNVTIPYKTSILPYLDTLDENAKAIGAVNCVQIKNGKTTGYNTDWIGFMNSLKPLFDVDKTYKAVVLGNGGAAKAVLYALAQMDIETIIVSRTKQETSVTYEELTTDIGLEYLLWINTTPVGMFPEVNEKLPIPKCIQLSADHICYDLIYNPELTSFLKWGKSMGALTKNGQEMLELQAEEGWKIWNS